MQIDNYISRDRISWWKSAKLSSCLENFSFYSVWRYKLDSWWFETYFLVWNLPFLAIYDAGGRSFLWSSISSQCLETDWCFYFWRSLPQTQEISIAIDQTQMFLNKMIEQVMDEWFQAFLGEVNCSNSFQCVFSSDYGTWNSLGCPVGWPVLKAEWRECDSSDSLWTS